MSRKVKVIILFCSFIFVFGIYNLFSKESKKINYIALGDSIAEGMNAYSNVDFGYPDYIKDYLEKNKLLKSYTKMFAKSGYTIKDLTNDIEKNKKIETMNRVLYLKEELRESDLVTLTIGANDFIKGITIENIEEKLSDKAKSKKDIDIIIMELKDLIILIKQYAKGSIIVTGYYNPLPRLINYKSEIDEYVKYYNNNLEELCDELNVNYINIFDIFDGNEKALPNPLNIHPNTYGYNLIANEIIKTIEELTK
ncbi:MAG: SGNH/GDSL hydrolase family protein [Bacilli bacterium]|nr:SGNH/GDSL hydrolase family protein [Bacilli bacterium]